MPPLRFGILGTGNIARQFAASFRTSARCTVTAVGSRALTSALDFVSTYAPAAQATDYEGLLQRSDVDAVYISLPNSMHHEWTLKALRAGKHVLCEKPLATSVAQAEEMFGASRKSGKLLIEAFMYVSHPLTRAYVNAAHSGAIGTLKHVRTSFCYRTLKIDGNVRFSPELAGGALMDIGCYCLSLSRLISGADPLHIAVEGKLHATGVDEQVSGLLRFPNDLTATFTAGMQLQADNTATLSGSDGYIEIPVPWKPPAAAAKWVLARSTPPKMDVAAPGQAKSSTVSIPPPPREEFLVDAGKDLYALEADDFAAAVAGEIPPAFSEAQSLSNMRMIQTIAQLIRNPKHP